MKLLRQYNKCRDLKNENYNRNIYEKINLYFKIFIYFSMNDFHRKIIS